MKVVAFNGSPRKGGNTQQMLEVFFAELQKHDIETELVQVGGHLLHGCIDCGKCKKEKNQRCGLEDDPVNEWIAKMIEADGIVLASPTYFADLTPEIKALIDRGGRVLRTNGNLLRHKVGAAVAVARRGGAVNVFDSLNHFFLLAEMAVCGSTYWNIGLGAAKGDVQNDKEGLQTMTDLGRNMAWLLKCTAHQR
ncbi:MAG: flavodoxin family protein [Candidatus Omnitrophica bacterium]|nr:flavodoxin family protein [Candidatus Omnitrophota bacterium]